MIVNGNCCFYNLDKRKSIWLPQVRFEMFPVCGYKSLGNTWLPAGAGRASLTHDVAELRTVVPNLAAQLASPGEFFVFVFLKKHILFPGSGPQGF